MKAKPTPYYSASMRTMLRNIAEGRPANTGIAAGNQSKTFGALRSRGWIDRCGEITDDGRKRAAK